MFRKFSNQICLCAQGTKYPQNKHTIQSKLSHKMTIWESVICSGKKISPPQGTKYPQNEHYNQSKFSYKMTVWESWFLREKRNPTHSRCAQPTLQCHSRLFPVPTGVCANMCVCKYVCVYVCFRQWEYKKVSCPCWNSRVDFFKILQEWVWVCMCVHVYVWV